MAKVDKFGKVARSVARWHLGCHFSKIRRAKGKGRQKMRLLGLRGGVQIERARRNPSHY